MRRLFFAVSAAFALGACVTAAPLDMDEPGGEWTLENLSGAPSSAPRPTILFDGQQVSGFAGCNRFSGQIQQDANVAAYFGPIGVTRMFCPGAAMEMETLFLDAMGKTRAVRVVDGKLAFFGEDESEIMRFAPEAAR